MVDVPTEAEILAAAAHEAGRAEAAADNAADDAREAAAEAIEAVEEVRDIAVLTVEAVVQLLAEALAPITARLDGLEAAQVVVVQAAGDAIDTAEEAVAIVADTVAEPEVVVVDEPPADNGLTVASEAPVIKEPTQQRNKRYRRI